MLNHKTIKLLVILTLALTMSFPLILPTQVAAQTDEYYHKSFAWDYDGNHWTWNLSIPKAQYDAYKEVSVYSRTRHGPEGYGYLTTTEDYYLRTLAKKLNETTTGLRYSSYDQVSFVLAFVQSLPYTSDNVTQGYNEYPRFPIETLVDDGGDCEDTSILFASLTLILGYGTVYLNPPNHYAVGILGNNLKGSYFTYPADSNKTYYYCETTGNGFKIGQLPEEFSGQKAFIYTIDQSKQFVPAIEIVPTPEPTPTPMAIITSATPTIEPNPSASSPPVDEPTIKPLQPISFNLISEQPFLFVLIIFAIVLSILLAVWSARRTKRTPPPIPQPPVSTAEPSVPPAVESESEEEHKFCIFCGSSNKAYAVFCEQCGKQIG